LAWTTNQAYVTWLCSSLDVCLVLLSVRRETGKE